MAFESGTEFPNKELANELEDIRQQNQYEGMLRQQTQLEAEGIRVDAFGLIARLGNGTERSVFSRSKREDENKESSSSSSGSMYMEVDLVEDFDKLYYEVKDLRKLLREKEEQLDDLRVELVKHGRYKRVDIPTSDLDKLRDTTLPKENNFSIAK